jgi:hypothetical protein
MASIAALTPHATPRFCGPSAARWRIGLALCASALTHAWLLTFLPPTQQRQLRPSFTINARIEAGEMAPESIFHGESPKPTAKAHELGELRRAPFLDPGAAPRQGKRSAPAVPVIQRQKDSTASAVPTPEPGARALPQPIDLTWFAAHELDSYPRALAPIKLDYPGLGETSNGGARLLLWLRIDEHGHVVEVSAGEAAVPGRWVEAARASLTTVRFTPARKDERAVKSRVLLSVNFDERAAGNGPLPENPRGLPIPPAPQEGVAGRGTLPANSRGSFPRPPHPPSHDHHSSR